MGSQETSSTELASLVYSPFTYVTRCLHLSDLSSCYRQRALVPQPLPAGVTVEDRPHAAVVWFQPSKSTLEHNWNGNVSFVMPINKIKSRFGANFYSLDQEVHSPTHTISRVLISTSNVSITKGTSSSRLQKVSLNTASGSPIRLCYGSWQHASRCRLQGSTTSLTHDLDIGIIVTPDDCGWLYSESFVDVNDHSSANSRCSNWEQYNPCLCRQYNSLGNVCPDECTRFETQRRIEEEFPLLMTNVMER